MFKATLNCPLIKEINLFLVLLQLWMKHAAGLPRLLLSQLQQKHCILSICFPEAFGRPRVFSLKSCHGPELVLYDMRYISPVNRCGTTHLGSRACSLLVFYACLLLFLVHFQGIAMMRTLKGGICQCIKYVERRLRVKCNYTDREGKNMSQKKNFVFPYTTFYFL